MKRLVLASSFLVLFSLFSQAQTIIRFVPEKIVKSIDNQPFGRGKIEQNGKDFSRRVRLELPKRTLQLVLTPSPIKQYDTILSSGGPIPSTVDFFEASAPN